MKFDADLRSRIVNDLALFMNMRLGKKIFLRLLRKDMHAVDAGNVMNLLIPPPCS